MSTKNAMLRIQCSEKTQGKASTAPPTSAPRASPVAVRRPRCGPDAEPTRGDAVVVATQELRRRRVLDRCPDRPAEPRRGEEHVEPDQDHDGDGEADDAHLGDAVPKELPRPLGVRRDG